MRGRIHIYLVDDELDEDDLGISFALMDVNGDYVGWTDNWVLEVTNENYQYCLD